MNRRDFFRGLLATTAIIPTVSTKTIVDLAANTWRNKPPGWVPVEARFDFGSLGVDVYEFMLSPATFIYLAEKS